MKLCAGNWRTTKKIKVRRLAWIFVPLHRTLIRSRMSNPLPHHRLAKTQISGAILPHRRQVSAAKLSRPRNGCSAPSAPSPPAWKNPALPRDPSAPGEVKGALQKKALNERSEVEKPKRRVLCTPELSPRSFRAWRQTSVSAVEPPDPKKVLCTPAVICGIGKDL